MRTHTQYFKDNIKNYGRHFIDVITMVTANNVLHPITQENINRVNYSVDTTLLKSVMQKIEIDINEDLDLDTYKKLDYQTKLSGDTQYIEFKYFNVIKKEQQKDKKSYLYTCYDNMIKTMVDYETPIVNGSVITYPITVRDYLSAICSHLGLTFKNASDTFTNYDKTITEEHYVDVDGNSMGYTFRDVLDDLAECVGGFICIDNLGQLEIRYITNAISSKNLFNGTYSRKTYGSHLPSGNTTSITINSSDENNVNATWNGNGYMEILTNTFQLQANTKYTISYTRTDDSTGPRNYIYSLDNSNNYTLLGSVKYTTGKITTTFTTTSSGKVAFGFALGNNNSGKTIDIKNIQLELGETATDYEPYYDTINEDYFSDKNVNIGKKVGAYNTLVLSRASDSDNIHRPTTLPQEPIELKISDNAILEQDNREDFIDGIFNQINGLEFYLNDFATTGILYYEIGDKYNVSIGGTTYPCLMLSDDIKRTTGLKENIHTDEPQQSVTDYKYSSTTDKVEISSRNAKILVDKANASIEQIVSAVGDNGEVTSASIIQSINNDTSQIKLEADKIDINGVVSANNNFKIKNDGSVEVNNGSIDLIDEGLSTTQQNCRITITSLNDNYLSELYSHTLKISNHSIDSDTGIEYDSFAIHYTSGYNAVTKETYTNNEANEYISNLEANSTYTGVYGYQTHWDTQGNGTQIRRGWYTIGADYSPAINLEYSGTTNLLVTNNANSNSMTFRGDQYIQDDNGNTTFEVDSSTGNTTIGGKLYLGQNGMQDYNSAGFTHDQYGNWKHKRNTSTDTWSIQDYNGNNKFSVYPETGNVLLDGILIDNDTAWNNSGMTYSWVYYKRRNGLCTVSFGCWGAATIPSNSELTIGTLPSGYRPSIRINFMFNGLGLNAGQTYGYVSTDGVIHLGSGGGSLSYFTGSVTFPID